MVGTRPSASGNVTARKFRGAHGLKYDILDRDHSAPASRPLRLHRAYVAWGKRVFDVVVSLLLLPALVVFCVLLLLLNPLFNRGPLFYVQPRMGRHCAAFPAVKFRTMKPAPRVTRRSEDPLEHDRITSLGRVLRMCRIDELPQILNVLRGEMSLIGPRPDYFHHARRYMRSVSGYRRRHDVRPGISGLAQIDLGYVENSEDTRKKVMLDLEYVDRIGLRLDLYLFWRTLVTVFGRKGC
jgi:lipopolysaccharide/colanic/teichoic acid biosynthesis glycosyltransferase